MFASQSGGMFLLTMVGVALACSLFVVIPIWVIRDCASRRCSFVPSTKKEVNDDAGP